jgi:hypothetical protein
LRSVNDPVNDSSDSPTIGGRAGVIRRRRNGYQVIVYAGIDPVTGHQRQISRQVKGGREVERLEASWGPRPPRAGTAARRPGRWPSCSMPGWHGDRRAVSRSPRTPSTTTAG